MPGARDRLTSPRIVMETLADELVPPAIALRGYERGQRHRYAGLSGVSDRELGRAVVARLEPWVEMVEHKVRALVAESLFEPLIPPRDVAFAIIALYLGIDMFSHLDGERSRAESLLNLGVRAAPLVQALLPSRPGQTR